MSTDTNASPAELLLKALQLTRAEELDCDAFHALLAPLLDERIDCRDVMAAMSHHRKICPECDEEVSILRAALGLPATGSAGLAPPGD